MANHNRVCPGHARLGARHGWHACRQSVFGCFVGLLLTAVTVRVAGAAGVGQVTQRKERCLQRLERAEVYLDQAQRDLERIIRAVETHPVSDPELSRRAENARGQVEHLRSRADAAWFKLDEVQAQLDPAQQTCSPCLASTVDLFCRQAENLEDESSEYLTVLADLQRDIRTARTRSPAAAGSSAAAADTTVTSAQPERTSHGTWRLITGVTYTHIDDVSHVDTTDQAVADSVLTLRSDPLTAYARASYGWRPSPDWVERISPHIYVSNQRASLGSAPPSC